VRAKVCPVGCLGVIFGVAVCFVQIEIMQSDENGALKVCLMRIGLRLLLLIGCTEKNGGKYICV
jgi:hypothetical protein